MYKLYRYGLQLSSRRHFYTCVFGGYDYPTPAKVKLDLLKVSRPTMNFACPYNLGLNTPSNRASTKAHALLVAVGILLSRLVGLVRDRVFAHYFGNSDAADAF